MAYNDLHTSFITLKNYLKILQSGKNTFWAADLDLSGGAINALELSLHRRNGSDKRGFHRDKSVERRVTLQENYRQAVASPQP